MKLASSIAPRIDAGDIDIGIYSVGVGVDIRVRTLIHEALLS